jgi:hypothetical protein
MVFRGDSPSDEVGPGAGARLLQASLMLTSSEILLRYGGSAAGYGFTRCILCCGAR